MAGLAVRVWGIREVGEVGVRVVVVEGSMGGRIGIEETGVGSGSGAVGLMVSLRLFGRCGDRMSRLWVCMGLHVGVEGF
jgi:hypothetical protein